MNRGTKVLLVHLSPQIQTLPDKPSAAALVMRPCLLTSWHAPRAHPHPSLTCCSPPRSTWCCRAQAVLQQKNQKKAAADEDDF